MHRIAIIHDPSSRHAPVWRAWLESAGFAVDTIYDERSFDNSKNTSYSLIIPLITIKDYVDGDNARMQALAHFSTKGANLLTSPAAISASSDKLETSKALLASSIPHPATLPADQYTWSSHGSEPLVLKPRFGHSGRDVRLIENTAELNEQNLSGMLVQQFIEQAACIRIIATSQEVLSSYKKVPPADTFIANINRGAIRQPIALTSDMEQLAQSTVEALGGGLMGVDLLDSPAGLFALEANVPFGFEKSDNQLRKNLIALIRRSCSLAVD